MTRVSDAGDVVSAVRIRFAGFAYRGLRVPKPRLANAHGLLTLTLPAVQGKRSLTLTASKTGYAPARITVVVH